VTRRLWPLLLIVAACTEDATSPGVCPNFCPGGSIAIQDTVFGTIIDRDSSFRGYAQSYRAALMTAADLPAIVDSRAFFVLHKAITRVAPKTGDTTTTPIIVDSTRLGLSILRRDTLATNLRLRLYRLPITADSSSTFASLDAAFNGPVVDSVNVSALLASEPIIDTATADSLDRRFYTDTTRRDSAGHILVVADSGRILHLYFHLDTLQAPVVEADSGQLAYGIRVAADSLASIGIGTAQSATPPSMQRFYQYTIPDTVTAKPDSIVRTSLTQSAAFTSFVFNPPSPALDSNLTVGGVPSARTLLRVALPKYLHDSIDVVRATLILMPVSAVQGIPGDSFRILVRPLVSDLGAKSPLGTTTSLFGSTFMHIGTADTVQIELTNLVRAWTLDTTLVTSIVLSQGGGPAGFVGRAEVQEAESYTEARFYSSRAPAFRPMLHVTYVHRFQFGKP
jgi:hypothetical protein